MDRTGKSHCGSVVVIGLGRFGTGVAKSLVELGHDVLAIVNGISTPIAPDQCMEDTGCTVECPTSPKACIVLNTSKVIAKRKVPARDQQLKTNVDGIYMIGDVSGVPLIKNAINEGGQVIDFIVEDLSKAGASSKAEYDVAIIGVGNCASAFVQGVHHYADADPSQPVPGLMHVDLGGYHINDIEFTAAFDVDADFELVLVRREGATPRQVATLAPGAKTGT